MSIEEIVKRLKKDSCLGPQITTYEYIQPKEAEYSTINIDEGLGRVLDSKGVGELWSHQAEAVELIRSGSNVITMTPTASGKSLIYNIPVIETLLEDPKARALYLFPLKGLEQDQVKNLNELLIPLGFKDNGSRSSLNPAEVYDGDTTQYRRKKIREGSPPVIFSNPDMLHHAINAYHKKWELFFRNLRFIIIDEIHAYRGVFGSNVAQVFRRLRRICRRWGSSPQFIASSATIANPADHAEKLTGLPFDSVEESGAPSGGRHFIFIRPDESPYTISTRLFTEAVKGGLKTIAFTKSRKITELIYSWCIRSAPELLDRVSPYRAGFLPKERRDIEARLFNGELSGVISTSALELGINIGGLDCCILAGYPGSISSTWQRAGRAGREGRDSLIIMVGLHDALDHYITGHPEILFEKNHEAAIADPDNEVILGKHLPCAAAEVYLDGKDDIYRVDRFRKLLNDLTVKGILRKGLQGDKWFPGIRTPHREVSIRGIGHSFRIVTTEDFLIGLLDESRVCREAFPGAIYLHRGSQYRITDLSFKYRRITVKESDADYYTQSLTDASTDIITEETSRKLGTASIHLGKVRISQRVTAYDRKSLYDRSSLSRHALDLPEYRFETEGAWIIIPHDINEVLQKEGCDIMGSLHGLEHASISCMPLFALCEKADIGGISFSKYSSFKASAIFIYDGYEGGVGYSRHAFGLAERLLETARGIIRECPCDSGCPSCIQDPQCGSGNDPLDKAGAGLLTDLILNSG